MDDKKVGIIAECVCDLPKNILHEFNIDIVCHLIETDSGVFTDTEEITAENVIQYMVEGGGKSRSTAPPVEAYEAAFRKKLKAFEEVILVSISSGISLSCENARKAVEAMGDEGRRIHVFDSCHLSTGLGHMVVKAAQLAKAGFTADKIIAELEIMKEKVSTTFITENADFLCRNGLVPDSVRRMCSSFSIHPVLEMKKGSIVLKGIEIGDYSSAATRYIRKTLKNTKKIDKKRVFITCAGCSVKTVNMIKSEIEACCDFEEIFVTKASATISSNCGPNTFGVLYVKL
ncbi:MAG: DegV family protein [Huintestinicola sp.]